MALNGSSYRPVMADTRTSRPPKTGGKLALLVFIFACAIPAIFLPRFRHFLQGLFPSAETVRMSPPVVVWANRQTGNYYCEGSRLYGKPPGGYMEQGEALTTGFQPALGRYCQPTQSDDSIVLSGHYKGHTTESRAAPSWPPWPHLSSW